MAENDKDVPGVIIFPPLIPLIVLVVGVLLDWLVPMAWLGGIWLPLRVVVGVVLFVGGLWIMQSGRNLMRRRGTNVRPTQPTLSLVTEGIFARTRNPLYVGGLVALLGIVIGFALEWAFPPHRKPCPPSLRRGVARGALSRTEVRRRLPRLQEERTALRLQALTARSVAAT